MLEASMMKFRRHTTAGDERNDRKWNMGMGLVVLLLMSFEFYLRQLPEDPWKRLEWARGDSVTSTRK
jgi:hypothetical protein